MPRCADATCGRWRPERLAPRWATGLRFNERWYCSRQCVENAAKARLDAPAPPAAVPTLPPLRLGVLLRHLGVLTDAQLAQALATQRTTGRRLGEELQRLAFVPAESVLRALAAQSSVSYLAKFDVSRLPVGPSWLPEDAVRALGIVPFELDANDRKVKVLCAAPVPKAALRALTKLTGWLAEAYMVEDAVLDEALRAYRSEAPAASPAPVTTRVTDVATAAARVADVAAVDRAVTMRHASYDQCTWVRVEGAQQWSDVWVMHKGEAPCLAASTAH